MAAANRCWVLLLLLVATFAQAQNTSGSSSSGHPLRQQLIEIEQAISSVRSIPASVISPDGRQVAYVIATPETGAQDLFVSSLAPLAAPRRIVLRGKTRCHEEEPAWSADGTKLAFLSDCVSKGQMQLFVLEAKEPAAIPRRLTNLDGHLAAPKWSPDGTSIALLFVDHATRAPNPMAAADAQTGVIDDLQEQKAQRLALVSTAQGETRMLSPADLNVFEYDWSPDSHTLAYTAAPPPGDDNWYIAQLYTQGTLEVRGHSLYQPDLQIAMPRWSPDGKNLAFIAGLMSDESLIGGDIYLLPARGGQPRNLTPDRSASPAWLQWSSPTTLLFAEYRGGSTAVNSLSISDHHIESLWSAAETVHAGGEYASLSVAANSSVALVRQSWTMPPEVWAGKLGSWVQVTHVNEHAKVGTTRFEDISWQSDAFHVQGWLLFPSTYDPSKRYPMLVLVHGGPAWIQTPSITDLDFDVSAFVRLGYFVFFPNPRGSFGGGEPFTQANRRDWGFGDLRDVVAGVDTVLGKYPVDAARVGMIGWSYGASTAMIAAGRTDRFHAFVAGAGASNLVSYYGQNQIDKWMLPYLGASAYDDPAAYMRSSALTYVKQVRAPVLLLVGERDEEAPPPQSFEFWHALKELHVPTQLVVYAGEGHSFEKLENRVDLMERAANWFAQYMPPTDAAPRGQP